MVYKFSSFELDTENYSLTNNGIAVALEPRTFDLLAYMVSNRDRLLLRRELLRVVWAGRVVTDHALTNLVQNARKALGDNGIEQAFIKTVHGRGYVFAAKGWNTADSADPANILSLPSIEKNKSHSTPPVVAVLPFQNIGPDLEQVFFAEGFGEDITTELSRFRDLSVIAHYSTSQYSQSVADLNTVSRELKADYVLEGKVRRANNHIRINVQLVNTESARYAWADRFEAPLDEVFDVQDEIIEKIASIVSGEVQHMEMERAQARTTRNLSAYDHLLRGFNHHRNGYMAREYYIKARQEFDQAIKLDPSFTRARVWKLRSEVAAWTCASIGQIEEYIELAKQVLLMDQKESESHRLLGSLYLKIGNYDLCDYHFTQAMQLNPNDALIVIRFAQYHACVDSCEMALSLANRAIRLNPRHPSWYWQVIGFIYYSLGQYEKAITAINKNWSAVEYDYALLAACHVAMNEIGKAKLAAGRALAVNPSCSSRQICQLVSYRDKSKVDLLENRMLKAGINP